MKSVTTATAIIVMLFSFQNIKAQAVKQITAEEAVSIALNNTLEMKARGFEIQSTQSLKKTINELPKTDVNYQFGQYNLSLIHI